MFSFQAQPAVSHGVSRVRRGLCHFKMATARNPVNIMAWNMEIEKQLHTTFSAGGQITTAPFLNPASSSAKSVVPAGCEFNRGSFQGSDSSQHHCFAGAFGRPCLLFLVRALSAFALKAAVLFLGKCPQPAQFAACFRTI